MLVGYLSGYQPALTFPPIKKSEVLAQNSNQQVETIHFDSFSEPIQLPHIGYLSTTFSSWHPGVDIATGIGTPIQPILKGQVVEATVSFWGLGNYVVIEHEQGIRSTYGHMRKIYVKPGDKVLSTSKIGEVGMTGWTSGPHTHLEVTKNGQYINPMKLLPTLSDLPVYYPAPEEVKPAPNPIKETVSTIKNDPIPAKVANSTSLPSSLSGLNLSELKR